MTVYKGFTIHSEAGGTIRIDEQPGHEVIRLQVSEGPPIYLDQKAWNELCSLDYRVEVHDPEVPDLTEPENDPA